MTSLKDVSKDRIMREMINAVQPASGWKVLIVDKITLRVISSCAKMYDIMENGVTLVESIEKARQPLPNVEAIYFLSPSPSSVDAVIKDYAKKPQYGAAHLFFSTHLPGSLFDKIKFSPLVDYIKTFKELSLEFLATESRTFSLDRGYDGFYNIYSPIAQDGMAELRLTALQLATVMVTLKENPYIRYSRAKPVCEKIAGMVANELRELRGKIPDYAQSCRDQRATLIIVDRSVDALAPILHEFTVQAMALDLLDVKNGEQYRYKYTDNKGETQEKDVLLSESSDKLWPTLRHMHIAQAIDYVIDGFNEFARNNKAAALSKGNVASLQEMSEAVRAMPEYRELLSKYSLHIELTRNCMDAFNSRGLQTIAEHEQDLAMGENAEGQKLKNPIQQITNVLSSPSVDPLDKLRLVMCYVISQEGLKDSDRQVLMRMASIPPADQAAIAHLYFLGVNLTKGKKKSNKKKDRQQRRTDDVPSYLSRYVPMVKAIVEDQVEGKLPVESYPYAADQPSGRSAAPGGGDSGGGKSLRQVRPKWAGGRSKQREDDGGASHNKPRVIVFVIGGATYSETRSAAECSAATGCDIIIGGSDLITPHKFIAWLRDLKKEKSLFDDE